MLYRAYALSSSTEAFNEECDKLCSISSHLDYPRSLTVYNYPPKGRWIAVDIYGDAKRRGIYPPLFTDPEGDSCFSIYQITWIKKCRFINGHNFFFWNFCETTSHFSLRSHNSEYPNLLNSQPRVMHFAYSDWLTQSWLSARKLLSTETSSSKDLNIFKLLIVRNQTTSFRR